MVLLGPSLAGLVRSTWEFSSRFYSAMSDHIGLLHHLGDWFIHHNTNKGRWCGTGH